MNRTLRMALYKREHGPQSIAATCMEITLYHCMSFDGQRHYYYWGLTNPATGHNWFTPLSSYEALISLACMLMNRGYDEKIGRFEQENESAAFVQRITFRLKGG